MKKKELKAQISELMRQYDKEEIDGPTYMQKMMELTTSAQNNSDDTDSHKKSIFGRLFK